MAEDASNIDKENPNKKQIKKRYNGKDDNVRNIYVI